MENQDKYENQNEQESTKHSSIGHFLMIFSGFITAFVLVAWVVTKLL